MTREEARRCLEAIKFMLDIEQYSDEVEQALNMAIEALRDIDVIERIDELIDVMKCLEENCKCEEL